MAADFVHKWQIVEDEKCLLFQKRLVQWYRLKNAGGPNLRWLQLRSPHQKYSLHLNDRLNPLLKS